MVEDKRRAAEDARRKEEDRLYWEAVGGKEKEARKVAGSVAGGGFSGVVDQGRVERARQLKAVEAEMQRLGVEKKQVREALGKLEALGGGVLGEERKQIKRALAAKEAAFNDAVRRHRDLRTRGYGSFQPAASSTMAAPSGRSVGGEVGAPPEALQPPPW